MDPIGVQKSILSLAGPGVQAEPITTRAVDLARKANDFLAESIRDNQDRYGGFAHLALQNPAEAANELERSIKELGFSGALINGCTNGAYLDDDRFSILWERAEELDVPIYIHPNNPPDVPTCTTTIRSFGARSGHGRLRRATMLCVSFLRVSSIGIQMRS